MSASKLQRIIEAVATRASAIDGTGDYQTSIGTSVRRTRVQPTENEVPCVHVYLDAREVGQENQAGLVIVASTLVVEGYVARTGSDDEGQGIAVLSDIQQAIETDDYSIGALIDVRNGGIKWQRDEILYPDVGNSVVGGRVEYSIPHLRKPGDPEKA